MIKLPRHKSGIASTSHVLGHLPNRLPAMFPPNFLRGPSLDLLFLTLTLRLLKKKVYNKASYGHITERG